MLTKIYKTEDRAADRVDVVRQTTGAWPGYLPVIGRKPHQRREVIGWRLTFDPDIAAGERLR
jgi:hypothetical protein